MPEPDLDVVAIGNAIVDVLSHSEDAFLAQHGLAKSSMTLIDAARAEVLYADMGAGIEVSGGSAANTVAGVAGLGGRCAFVGKVRDDQLGAVFAHDLQALGIAFDTAMAAAGPPTGRCLILVTPDAQRTMNTFLGASSELGPGDVDDGLIARARITYLEGYLWDRAEAKNAFRKAAAAAEAAGRRVAFTLSDPFCVDRWRAEFLELIDRHVHILFANEAEIISLYQVESFEAAVAKVRGHCEIAVLTRSEKGSMLLRGDEVHVVDAEPARVTDTTGAGDLYAAGVLAGLMRGRDLATCGRMGAICARRSHQPFRRAPRRGAGRARAASTGLNVSRAPPSGRRARHPEYGCGSAGLPARHRRRCWR